MLVTSWMRDSDNVLSSEEQFAANTIDVFVLPFAGGDTIHLQNMGNTHEKCMFDDDGRVLDAYNQIGKLDEKMAAICSVKDTRMIAPTRGSTLVVASEEKEHVDANHSRALKERFHKWALQRSDVETGSILGIVSRAEAGASDYILYLLETDLIQPEDLSKLLFVKSFTDYDEILKATAESGRVAVPYNPAPDFLGLCRRYGVPTYGTTSESVGALADKHYFREFAKEHYPQFFASPRMWIPQGREFTSNAFTQLRELIRFSVGNQPKSDENTAVLFVQKTLAGGGAGNYIVRQHPDGTLSVDGQTSVTDLAGVAGFISSLDRDVEVAPFLNLVASPSFGIVSGTQGASCIGPFTQILNDRYDYLGFTLNRGETFSDYSPDVAEFLKKNVNDLTDLSLQIGKFQSDNGYVGYSNIDVLIYRDESGQLRLTLAEMNLRYTATCPLQMILHSQERFRTPFLRDELSLLHHDLVPLSSSVLAETSGRTTEISDLLRDRGIPLVDSRNDRGAIIMARPAPSIAGLCVGIAVIADTDVERDRVFADVWSVLA